MASNAKIIVVNSAFTFGAPQTKRNESWLALKAQRGTRTVARYLANGGARKYLARWERAGVIAFA